MTAPASPRGAWPSQGSPAIWVVRCQVGASWDGRAGLVGAYRWKWRADLAALLHRLRFPHRRAMVTPVAACEWHPWRVGGRWGERRVLAPWFSAGASDREQFRRRPTEEAACGFDLECVSGEAADDPRQPEITAPAVARRREPVDPV